MKRFFFLLLIYAPAVAISQDFALERLNESPSHHEWVKIESSDKALDVFVVYPEISNPTISVLVIHENRGLTDWVRSMADQIAEAGYIAVAPDLLSGKAPDGGKTSDFANSDDARTAIYQLDPDAVTADLNVVYKYMIKLPASNGKSAVMGFCWGGSQTFRYATNNSEIGAAMVFYGTRPVPGARRSPCSPPDRSRRPRACGDWATSYGTPNRVRESPPDGSAPEQEHPEVGPTCEHSAVIFEGGNSGCVFYLLVHPEQLAHQVAALAEQAVPAASGHPTLQIGAVVDLVVDIPAQDVPVAGEPDRAGSEKPVTIINGVDVNIVVAHLEVVVVGLDGHGRRRHRDECHQDQEADQRVFHPTSPFDRSRGRRGR